jgi:hypothetical protein
MYAIGFRIPIGVFSVCRRIVVRNSRDSFVI